ncbi:hypothetical protein CROQUDRAFT_650315 [Cronartium quercuum f. sp. fusiforme G11]|uniref:TAFII55 protein conserved region domain-containing protein n=1 Tax=Cronartium quercuum f. sp. fusiforme G11 TaxID=708437 RepID=A0A9P6NRU0_9BASI|nr:hypothetical protein CROQUDRAFT_650315 [Cronartium quercuum f. sp. fusiforme G11]
MSDAASPIPSTSSRAHLGTTHDTHDGRRQTSRSNAQAHSRNDQPPTTGERKLGTKLKLKIASQEKTQSGSGISSYLQGFERELDSDPDEPIAFEEQFILKMPPGPDCEKLRGLVDGRKDIDCETENLFFKFKDSRRGVFNIGKRMYGMKLVDLPCIIESQKTFDNKHVFKVADICQMIQVEDGPINDESSVSQGNFNIEDFICPHGITPPLHHVRKRRFRKRLNKRTIETVERAVERLLEEDSRADQVIIDIVDNVRDLSDSEGDEYQPPSSATGVGGTLPSSKVVYNKARPSISSSKRSPSHQLPDHSNSITDLPPRSDAPTDSHMHTMAETPAAESIGGQTPAPDFDDFGEDRTVAGYDENDDEGSIDSDLAAEIEAGLMEGAAAEERAAAGLTGLEDGDEEDEDSEDLFGNGEDDDEDDEDDEDDDDEEESNQTVEDKQRVRLLQGELKDLEAAINRKKSEIAKAANVILRKRFEEALKKLTIELESKKTQLSTTQLNLENAAQERKNLQQRQDKGEEDEVDQEIPPDPTENYLDTDDHQDRPKEMDIIFEPSEDTGQSTHDRRHGDSERMTEGDDEPMLSVEQDIPTLPDSLDIDVMAT